MKNNFSIAIISIIFCGANVLHGESYDSKMEKWTLFNDFLFYLNPQQKFTALEAQKYCMDTNMADVIQSDELINIAKLIIKEIELSVAYWIFDETFVENASENNSARNCYALGAGGTYSEFCESLKGVICKQEINGGIVQFKNGSRLIVDVDGVHKFCKPESNLHNDILEYCLIKMLDNVLLRGTNRQK